jgi:hypothetical protein
MCIKLLPDRSIFFLYRYIEKKLIFDFQYDAFAEKGSYSERVHRH